MRFHMWRMVLNNRAIARRISAKIKFAYFGHMESMSGTNDTDLTELSIMFAALKE